MEFRPPKVRIPTELRVNTGSRWDIDTDYLNKGESDTGYSDPRTDKPLPGMLSVPEQEIMDAAGRKQANDFWGGVGSVIKTIVDNSPPVQAWNAGKPIRDAIGSGLNESFKGTESALGALQGADLLQRKLAYQRLQDSGAHADYQRSEGQTRITGLGSPGPAKGLDALTDNELDRLNSYLRNMGSISQETGVAPEDWRVQMESGRRMREENPSWQDAAASMLLDPTNLALAPIGGGAAAAKLARGAGRTVAGVGDFVDNAGSGVRNELADGFRPGAGRWGLDTGGGLDRDT